MVKRGEFLDTAWTQLVVATAGRGAPREMLHRASGEGGLGAEPAGMGPAAQQLGGADGADPGPAEQGRGHDGDELTQLGLQLLASWRAVRARWAVRASARTVARCSTGSVGRATSPAQTRSCWRQGRPRRLSRSGSGAVTIRALSWRRASVPAWTMPARVLCRTRSASRYPRWRGEVVAGQGVAAGPDRVQHSSWPRGGPRGRVGRSITVHPLTLVDQTPGQPGPIAARPFQRPHPPARCMHLGQPEQPGMASPGRLAPPGWPGPRRWGPAGPRQGGRGGGRPRGPRRPGPRAWAWRLLLLRRRPLAGTGLGWRHHAAAGR
jgi:hypothetical protein